MKVVTKATILDALDEQAGLAAIETGFRRFSAGEVQLTAVGQLSFRDPPGDLHVKGAYTQGDDVFVVKLATSFYQNPQQGLPSSNGFMAVVSARTGELLALLHDEGALTDWRTAFAGAIAARAILRRSTRTLGIVGAGTQAQLQAKLISRLLNLSVLVWARKPDAAATLAAEVGGESCSLHELCERSDLIVTTTPSAKPLLYAEMIHPGTRIVAVGADAPGKQEIDVEVLARARIIVDSRAQCVDHGDTSYAVRAGRVNEDSLVELGTLLSNPIQFDHDDIVVADLTGLGIQDAQIAKSVWSRLQLRGS